jgi:hypothetical protein
VHDLAEKQGPDVSALYACRHAEKLFKQGEYGLAAQVRRREGGVDRPDVLRLLCTACRAPASDEEVVFKSAGRAWISAVSPPSLLHHSPPTTF